MIIPWCQVSKISKLKIRNRLAMWAWKKSGAGKHKDKKKYNRKKHKKVKDEEP